MENRPLAKGLLTGKAGPDRRFGDGDHRREDPRFSIENRQRVADLLEKIRPIAEQHNFTFAQLANEDNRFNGGRDSNQGSPWSKSSLDIEGHQYFSICSITNSVPFSWLT